MAALRLLLLTTDPPTPTPRCRRCSDSTPSFLPFRTAFVALPGGIGTLDETVELMVLQQLNKLGTNYEVPIILMNYQGYWNGFMQVRKKYAFTTISLLSHFR